tara:strand:+ start:45 stop:221 length:177 start_codon:yes stop_codon:yes gene_type:complete
MAFKMKPGSPMERNYPGAFKKQKKNFFSRIVSKLQDPTYRGRTRGGYSYVDPRSKRNT